MSHSYDRAFYRISYPIPARPLLRMGGVEHEVVDCSERGMRYRVKGEPPGVDDPVSGVLVFKTGSSVTVTGRVLRVQEGEVAVQLVAPGIPMGVILDEQRFLRARYPLRAEG